MSGLPDYLQGAYDSVYYLAFNLARAVLAFLQRDSYLYWPFILSTLAIMLFAAFLAARSAPEGLTWRQQFREYFSGRVWWHASARADYRLYFINALVLPALFGWLLFSDAHIAGFMDSALGREAVPAGQTNTGFAVRLAYTVVFFIAYDFGRFVAHTLLHDVPALWEFHKVHHSAEVLTPMTAYRAHPVDLLVMAWIPALLTGLATWLFNLLAPGKIGFFTFLGLHVALWAVNLIDNLRHSHVWVTYGPVAGKWIVSPAHHQLHHSCEPRHETNGRGGCNRGFSLALWDRWYGTLKMPEREPEKFRMGLGDGTDNEWHSVTRMYALPFAGCLRRFRSLFGRSAPQ
jgi:sterol desaturase/sphingolipid hydroxylase (fatty acid hydroxylase superfamily)